MTVESGDWRAERLPWKTWLRDRSVESILWFFAVISLFTTTCIVIILFQQSAGFFDHVHPVDFLFGTKWTPLIEPRSFGVLPILYGTLFIACVSTAIAMPIGVLVAVFLSQYAEGWVRDGLKAVLELLAGIPSVVLGYFAFTFITPSLQMVWPQVGVFNALSAALAVAIMVLPTIASLTDDALRAVPDTMQEAAYALGATKFEVVSSVIFPAAVSGMTAAFVLAFSRAVGETMAVTLAAGATPNLTLNPFESIQTITAYIVQVTMGDTPHGTLEYQTVFVVGLLLFFLTLVMNLLSQYVRSRAVWK